MRRVLIATADTDFAERARAALAGAAEVVRLDPMFEAFAQPRSLAGLDVVMIDASATTGFGDGFADALATLRAGGAECPVLAIGDAEDARLVLAAIRAGAADFIGLGREGEALAGEIARHFRAQAQQPGGSGSLVCVVSGQAGSGENLYAANLAAMRAKSSGDTILIDCSLPASEAVTAFDLSCRYAVRDAVNDIGRMDRTLLGSALARHEASGLYVLPLVAAEEDVGDLSPADLRALLDTLRTLFTDVVLNLGDIRDPSVVAELGCDASALHVVTTQSLTSVVAAKRLIDHVRGTGMVIAPITVIIDDYRREVTLTQEHIGTALATDRTVCLPAARAELINALNTGQPFVLAQPRSPYARAIAALAAGEPAARRSREGRRGFFARLLPAS